MPRQTSVNWAVRNCFPTHKAVLLREQGACDMEPFREMLGGHKANTKDAAHVSDGDARTVRATLVVEINDETQVSLGRNPKLSGLTEKVISVPLISLSSDFVSIGGEEQREEFTKRNAEDIFILQLLALASTPEAERAYADYWLQMKPLPGSQWRPPLLFEVQEARRAAGGAAAAAGSSTTAPVKAYMDTNYEKTVVPPADGVLLEANFTILSDLHKLLTDNVVRITPALLKETLQATGFQVAEVNRKVQAADGSTSKKHIKNAVFVRRRGHLGRHRGGDGRG